MAHGLCITLVDVDCGYLLFHNSTSYLDTQHLHINDWKCANFKNWKDFFGLSHKNHCIIYNALYNEMVTALSIQSSSNVYYSLYEVLWIQHRSNHFWDRGSLKPVGLFLSLSSSKVFPITCECFVQRSCLNKNFHELCFAITVIA